MELDAGVLVKVFDINSYDFDNIEPKSGAPLLKPMGQRNLMEIYARDGASFLKETDKFGFCKGFWQYSYQIPAHPMWFNREEICYMMRNQRSMSCYGFAPTQAILDIIKSLHYSTLYNKRFFEETAIPDGVLSILDTAESEMKNFIDMWTREFQAQPHKFAVVNKQIDWKPLTALQRELEFLETQNWYYKLVISAFGLTPAELGVTEDLNRATSATQSELSRRKGIRPLLKIIEAYFNEEIIPEFGVEGIEFQFIFDDPTEKNQRLTNYKMELDMNLRTINEVREELGFEPVEWGEEPTRGIGILNPQENQGESPGYTDNRNREEGKIESKSFFKGIQVTGDLLNQIASQYNYKGDLEELRIGIDEEQEHADVVGEDIGKIALIALAHLKEDPKYYSKLKTIIKKGIDDGQYYREPLQVNQPSRGKIVQPQQKPTGEEKPKIKPTSNKLESLTNSITCPYCGNPALAEEDNIDSIYGTERRWRCNFCHAYMTEQELIDNQVIADMTDTFMGNTSTQVINVPGWSPKMQKDIDLNMKVKEFVGFDYMKQYDKILSYINSKEYEALIRKYFPTVDVNKVRKILRDGIRKGLSIREIAKNLDRIFKDKNRSFIIARTEISRVVNEGKRQELEDKKWKEVMWISAPEDGRLCEHCKKLDGRIFTIKEIKNKIPLHPHCRCTFSEYVRI
jgi:SPP1 gp7 family putative phage head morphogenesis protein